MPESISLLFATIAGTLCGGLAVRSRLQRVRLPLPPSERESRIALLEADLRSISNRLQTSNEDRARLTQEVHDLSRTIASLSDQLQSAQQKSRHLQETVNLRRVGLTHG